MLVFAILAACGNGPDDDRPPEITRAPSVGARAPHLPLARWFHVETDLPTTLSLAVAGPDSTRDIVFSTLARSHRVPLLGLRADTTYVVTATLETAAGQRVEAEPFSFSSGPLPADIPSTEAVHRDPDRIEPGLTLLTANDEGTWILAVDDEGHTVYAQQGSQGSLSVTPDEQGRLWTVEGESIVVRSIMGEIVSRFTRDPSEPFDVEVALEDFHHEIVPQPDGSFWSLSYVHADVPEYPTSYETPTDYAPATIRNDLVVHVAPDGEILQSFGMLDLLDARRIGFDSLSKAPSGALDWVHSNALQYDADTEMLTVSLRHQDAVVRFSAVTGEIEWIFAAPHGWPPELEEKLLVPTAPFVWPTHQHGIQIRADGRLRLFDNGNDLRGTPYASSGDRIPYSRIFEAEIDPVARTVTQVATYDTLSGGWLFVPSLGNADLLPSGNRLGTWGPEGRVAEFAPDGSLVFEFVVVGGSYRVDRAIRIPSLYPPGTTERVRQE